MSANLNERSEQMIAVTQKPILLHPQAQLLNCGGA